MMIEEIRRLRRLVSTTLAETLNELDGASEFEIAKRWHQRLSNFPDLAPEGWYSPPPHGIILSIGNPPDFGRVNQKNFRLPEAWPNANSLFRQESLLFVYASPIQKTSGLIGDLACSLYRGPDIKLQNHMQRVWDLTMQISEFVQPGMAYSSLHAEAMRLINQAGLSNIVESATDGHSANIGHSLPWFEIAPTLEEQQNIGEFASSKRLFINSNNQREIAETTAFTIEPRLVGKGLPAVGFHVIVAFEDGKKQVITEFDPLFDLFEMDYLR